MSPSRLGRLALIALAGTIGCSDAPAPFVPPPREPPSEPAWQLTFNPGDDRTPTWTRGSDRVIYSAEGFDGLPDAPGVLASIPFQGGVAEQALINVQKEASPTRWLTTPSVTPDGARLAFAHIIFRFEAELCGISPTALDCGEPVLRQPVLEPLPRPRLGTVALRVRRFDTTGPLSQDPSIEVAFEGRVLDGTQHPFGLPGVWLIDYHPFHQVNVEEGTLVFRPHWSPDGERIAFSDGLRLLVWNTAQGTVAPIPGTSDGTSPAWSPDGESIAFTRLERAGSSTSMCTHLVPSRDGLTPACVEQRTTYTIGRRILSLVRPDGSGVIEVGEGEEPAWAPDGKTIFYRDRDQIWQLNIESGAVNPVPRTESGREPAVSPDGRHLAFAKRTSSGKHDIWIVLLEP